MSRQKAAIVGGGVIGGGWAARFLLMGWDVAVHDPDPDAERKVGEMLSHARRSLPALYEVALPTEGTLRFCDTLEPAVEGAVWIQESIPERLDLKHRVFDQIQAFCDKSAVIGSSTSGFKPSELSERADRPAQIIVAHPFNPVYLLPLVELVGDRETTDRATAILKAVGMMPLTLRKEIDAHIADRLMEAVWREGLWLVKDGIASTEEIDDAIRFGFGLRWAQMGLFETFRIAGGEAGMAHFLAQFGPALQWPWTKLMDVPELTDDLVKRIADQSDAQSGRHSIRDLERIRDDNLVSMMRALKGRGWGVGRILNGLDEVLAPSNEDKGAAPLVTVERTVPVDWSDYNGHMNESRYGQVFSDASDGVMKRIGADAAYIAAGQSFFTVEIGIRFLEETLVGDSIRVTTQVLQASGKKLELFHRMCRADDGRLLATGRQFLLHVDLKTRRSSVPEGIVAERMAALAAAHADLPPPD